MRPESARPACSTRSGATAASLPRATVICEAYESGRPYWASSQLLRSLFGIEADAEPDAVVEHSCSALVAERGARPRAHAARCSRPRSTSRPRTRRRRPPSSRGSVASGSSARSASSSRRRSPKPALIVVEDAHWMDEVSIELASHLGALTRRTARGSCASPGARAPTALGTAREHDVAAARTPHRRRRGRPGHRRDRRTRRCARTRSTTSCTAPRGNPLFLGELIAMTRGGAAAASLPESVEGAAHRRDRQPRRRSPAGCSASPPCSGRSFERALLEDVVGEVVDDVDTVRRPRPPPRGRRRPAGCASATRSSATPPTKGSPTSGGASCTPAPARPSNARPATGPTSTPSCCRSTSSRPGATPTRGATRASARRTPTTPTRTSRPRRSTSAPSSPAGGPARSRPSWPPSPSRSATCRSESASTRRRSARTALARRLLRDDAPGAGPHDREGGSRRRTPGPLLDVGPLDPKGPAAARRHPRRRRIERRGPSST